MGGKGTFTTRLGAIEEEVKITAKDGILQDKDYVIHFPVPMANVWNNARRARNRKAQNVYRVRRDAAQKDQTSRLLQLENVVEEMSSSIEAFTREMLSSSVVKERRELLLPLRKMTTAILALASEADRVDKSEVSQSLTTEGKDGKYKNRVSHGENIDFATGSHSESSQKQDLIDKMSVHDVGTYVEQPSMESTSYKAISLEHDRNVKHMERWLSEVKLPTGFGLTQALPVGSLAYRLVYSTITTALTALLQPMQSLEPPSQQSRTFGVPSGTQRASLISHYRWLLGPGAASLYDCAKLSFIPNESAQFTGVLPKSVQAESPLLSVMDIESRLISLGARSRDQEFIELAIDNPYKPEEEMGPHFLSHWALGNFDIFHAGPPKKTTVTLHLKSISDDNPTPCQELQNCITGCDKSYESRHFDLISKDVLHLRQNRTFSFIHQSKRDQHGKKRRMRR
ncbi:hypothetical protein FBEOM_3199 [Fusarium beomiforme]|uniref:BZIP domain-containing protein n=1 Tax=Fusarium beomiforme TaxID=44412 RepID=A0A9P5E1N7_9HYPO|nr:hypothetical protein FBEOM_3199 [Fusarium beomiforme]